ncbi:Uncharacterised protein [Vibrio cholerae]|nr:Uncharacterised protein [Vibrio cholerae]CSH85261.1 Uncharacterised protein [Vibrio cholerae]CSI73679.1 Uncharacterised protein [Vibrio cholerae]
MTHFRHHSAYVRKVDVNHAWASNQFSDALHCIFKYVVRARKGFQ